MKTTQTTIAIAAAIAVAAIAAACASPRAPRAAAHVAPAAPATTSAAVAAPALSAADQKFISDMRSQFGLNGSTSSDIAQVGATTCALRSTDSQPATVSDLSDMTIDGISGNARIVRLAEKDLCPEYLPSPPPKPLVIVSMSGSGIQNSAPVTVTSGTLTANYSYDCSSQGTGNFIADFETPDQSSLNSDDLSIANALGGGGSATTTIYPQNVGSQYYLSVNSECNWSVTIESP